MNVGSDLSIAKERLLGWPQRAHTGSKEEGAWGIDVGIGVQETDRHRQTQQSGQEENSK